MACLGISLGDLLPSWFKRFVAIPSSNWSYTSSSRNTSSPEGIGSHGSCRSAVNWEAGYVPGITDLPCPPAAHLPASSFDEVDECARRIPRKPFSFHQTPPLPIRSRARSNYSPTLGMLFIPALFILFWVWCTDPVGIKQFISYEGVRYKPDSPYYLWLFVKYNDSSVGYVTVPPLSFNADVSLQAKLKDLIPKDEWGYLQQRYGFGFIDPMM